MVTSYLDDGVILVSTGNKQKTKRELKECIYDCVRIAKERGINFRVKKIDWMGIGKGELGTFDVEGVELKMVKKKRILGYSIDTKREWRGHV